MCTYAPSSPASTARREACRCASSGERALLRPSTRTRAHARRVYVIGSLCLPARSRYGESNPTYHLRSSRGQEYVLRRRPPGKLLPGAHRVRGGEEGREVEGGRWREGLVYIEGGEGEWLPCSAG